MALEGVVGSEFKSCMSTFVTGVTVVTCVVDDDRAAGDFVGITINSFNSVSLVPPMVLFSLSKDAYRYRFFSKCVAFVVNVLSASQKDLAEKFAENSNVSWDGIKFFDCYGIPVLGDVQSFFYCVKEQVYSGGDHDIIVGRVDKLDRFDCLEGPLLYYDGKYYGVGEML